MFMADYKTVLEYSLRYSASGIIYIFISSFYLSSKHYSSEKNQIKQKCKKPLYSAKSTWEMISITAVVLSRQGY